MREQGRRWAELPHPLRPDAPDLIPAIRGPRAQQLIGTEGPARGSRWWTNVE